MLVLSSCRYQTDDRSRHTVAKDLNDEKTHSAKNSEMFMRLSRITNQLYELERVKPKMEQWINFGCLVRHYAKHRASEIFYKFFKKFCDADMYEELEEDTDSL